MLNNFIYAQTKALFEEHLLAGNILDEAIVFIEDTKEIWNHGTYFGGADVSKLEKSIEGLSDAITAIQSGKQDTITDLETIRSGAAAGTTALQSVPEEYITETELTGRGYLTANDLVFAEDGDIDGLFA